MTDVSRANAVRIGLQDNDGTYTFLSSALSNHQRVMMQRQHMNVLMWVNSDYSINQINKLIADDFNANINDISYRIPTGEQTACIYSIISFLSQKTNDNVVRKIFDFVDKNSTGSKSDTLFDKNRYTGKDKQYVENGDNYQFQSLFICGVS